MAVFSYQIVHEGAEVSEPTLPASVEASEGLPLPSEDKATGNAKKAPARRGRVVGIIRRNWRQLAGSLDLTSLPTTAAVDDATTVLFQPKEMKLPPMLLTTRRAEVFTICILLYRGFNPLPVVCG